MYTVLVIFKCMGTVGCYTYVCDVHIPHVIYVRTYDCAYVRMCSGERCDERQPGQSCGQRRKAG